MLPVSEHSFIHSFPDSLSLPLLQLSNLQLMTLLTIRRALYPRSCVFHLPSGLLIISQVNDQIPHPILLIFSSFQLLSCVQLFATPWTAAHQASAFLADCSNSCPSSRSCHPIISSSVVPFSSCLQSFPASESFQMSQFFPSGGQSIGVSASASVLLLREAR